jgi:hypothetical protein
MIRMSDAELFREVDEDYRRERMIVFWRRYGGIFLALAIAAMLASAAYNYYVSRELARKAADTEAFESLLNDISSANQAESIVALSTFAASATPMQATLAHFTEAAIKQRMGNVAAAAGVYHQIADGDQAPADLKDLAVVRLGYLAADAAKPEPLIPRLEVIAGGKGPWRFGAREAMALLKAKAGQRDDAAKILSDLALDPGTPPDMAARDRALAEFYRGK